MALHFTPVRDNPLSDSPTSDLSSTIEAAMFSFENPACRERRQSSLYFDLKPGEEFVLNHRENDWPLGGVPIFLYIQSSVFAAFVAVSNYRLLVEPEDPSILETLRIRSDYFEVPLLMILKCERSISREIITIELTTKDERNIKFAIRPDLKLKSDVFEVIYNRAFSSDVTQRFCFSHKSSRSGWALYDPFTEYGRLGVKSNDPQGWAFVDNSTGSICNSYGSWLVVPKELSLDQIKACAQFRTKQRFPCLVWQDPARTSTLWRSSQPKTGIAGRCLEDEVYLQLIAFSCKKRLLHIYDCRPYINAHANRAKGGGVEPKAYYRDSDLSFLNIANIHAVRDAWKGMLTTVNSAPDNRYFSAVEKTGWLDLLHYIMLGTQKVVESVTSGYAVLVHCSDGWDRTAQLSSLSQICLDSYYRTSTGFATVIEKDWLSFGHMFDKRFGHGNSNSTDEQRAPIFIQFLDCVHQLLLQFPTYFEFNEALLLELVYHSYSGCYGTFMGNHHQDRLNLRIYDLTPSIWGEILGSPQYKNPFYQPGQDEVLFPNSSLRRLQVWHELFSKWNPEFYSSEVKQHKESIMRSASDGLDYLRLQLKRAMDDLHCAQKQLAEHESFLVFDD